MQIWIFLLTRIQFQCKPISKHQSSKRANKKKLLFLSWKQHLQIISLSF